MTHADTDPGCARRVHFAVGRGKELHDSVTAPKGNGVSSQPGSADGQACYQAIGFAGLFGFGIDERSSDAELGRRDRAFSSLWRSNLKRFLEFSRQQLSSEHQYVPGRPESLLESVGEGLVPLHPEHQCPAPAKLGFA